MKKFLFITIILLYHLFSLSGQNIDYAISVLDTLASPGMYGRGYVNNGEKIAADFIKNEFKGFNLKKFSEGYFQFFSFPINTFPDTIIVTVDKDSLSPGKDFVLFSSSPAVSGTFDLIWFLTDSTGKPKLKGDYGMIDISDKVIVTNADQKEFENVERFNSKGIIFLMEDKVWWHVSNGKKVNDFFALQIVKDKIPETSKSITIRAKNSFISDYKTQNVIGYIEGRAYPDSFFVFTAHYDHLGQMGEETFFPGANDNASGTAMLLDLARHYSQAENQPDYSMAFIAFSAEEVGLIGSDYYTSNPLFPLEKIKFLINLDMVGSGSEGIKVVNGSVYEKEFNALVRINSENEYIRKVSSRGEAPNSDHFPFYQKGVPCFFIYTLGKECIEYHNIYDTPENVPFTEYKDVFRLLRDFVETTK